MKNFRLYAGTAALLILLTGCAQKDDNSAGADAADGAQVKTVYGEIYEVIGNSITVKTIEMPQTPTGEDGQPVTGGRFQMSTDENGNPVGGSGFQISTDENGDRVRGGGFQMPTDENGNPVIGGGFQMSTDENGDPVRGGGSFQMSTDENGNPVRGGGVQMSTDENGDPVGGWGGTQRQINYTGEQVEVIIPVGIKITSSSYGSSGAEEKEIELSDLKAGDIISVVYAADGVSVEKVSVINTESGGRMNFPAGGLDIMPDGNMPQGNIVQG